MRQMRGTGSVRLASVAAGLLLAGCASATPGNEARPDARSASSVEQSPEATAPSGGSEHSIELYHCGIEATEFEGRRWAADPPPFDSTNVPEKFVGHGTMTVTSDDTALFADESGIEIEFVRVDEAWEPEPCL